jgi:hypothetical protein
MGAWEYLWNPGDVYCNAEELRPPGRRSHALEGLGRISVVHVVILNSLCGRAAHIGLRKLRLRRSAPRWGRGVYIPRPAGYRFRETNDHLLPASSVEKCLHQPDATGGLSRLVHGTTYKRAWLPGCVALRSQAIGLRLIGTL